MRALVSLAFSLYQWIAVLGTEPVSSDAQLGCRDPSFISTINNEFSEIKSILKEYKGVLEGLQGQGLTSGTSCLTLQYDINELKSTVADQKAKLEALQKQLADKPKVAFSAALFGQGGQTVGGYTYEDILKFQKVFTNIGDAYSPSTGKFTAPVKGVYYFGFSAFANDKYSMGVHLRKNAGVQVVSTYDYNSQKKDVNGANRAVLLLEKGDEVYIGLWSGLYIFDSYNSVSTFSGFLIFPM